MTEKIRTGRADNLHASALLKGKVALVTGAAAGIGKRCAMTMAANGADVVLTDIDEPHFELFDYFESVGRKAVFHRCDVRDESAQLEVISKVEAEFGALDIVVANAGIAGYRAPIEKYPIEKFEEVMATNVRGTFLTIKHAVPLLKRKGGSIIVMSSVQGVRTIHHGGTSIYGATKAAVSAMAKALAIELARFNIRVNIICPGKITTNAESKVEMDDDIVDVGIRFADGSPMLGGGTGSPEEVADICLMLASEQSRHVTGNEIFVDGGESLIA